jgi:hypothetical protein
MFNTIVFVVGRCDKKLNVDFSFLAWVGWQVAPGGPSTHSSNDDGTFSTLLSFPP